MAEVVKLFRCSQCARECATYHDESQDGDPGSSAAVAFLNQERWRRWDNAPADASGAALFCPWCAARSFGSPARTRAMATPSSALPSHCYVLRARCGHATHYVVEPPADDLTARRALVGDLVALSVSGDVQTGGWIERDEITAVRCGPHVSIDGVVTLEKWLTLEHEACLGCCR